MGISTQIGLDRKKKTPKKRTQNWVRREGEVNPGRVEGGQIWPKTLACNSQNTNKIDKKDVSLY